ncbi:MAG: InlB B-repeat-containing protein, partial [Oscillospiraceae bacterium]|nr:InlB B-repeat-containing protein [Oscillospiraceae bacterium]
MKHISKRLLAFLLMLAMVFSMLPAMAFAAEDEQPEVELITAEDDALVEADILDDIDTYFDNSATRSGELTLADYVEAADDVKAMVMASDTYVEGSIVERGDGFFWQTTTGITCGYFPKDRYEADQRVATKAVNTSSLATWNYANATSKDVCLVAPMYSEDSTFTNQYVNEALAIAESLGGTAYGLIDTAATVTAIGQALEKCGVVIFDSHGNTDWGYFDGGSDGTGEADCVTEANTSYLCLSSGTGMTTADCAYVTGKFGNYPHAYKDSYGNYVADGTAFANHMNGNAPGSLLWMAICLGMSTEGFCTPLRNKGVEVVYGYSQSVTFYGDYLYEEYFWDKMCAGETVATAASYMKTTAGCKWDPYYSSYSESSARNAYAAFPVVVSDQDAYPGQRSSTSNGACSVQTVKSTYTLFSNYEVTATTNNSSWGTVSVSGSTITASPASGYYAAGATVTSGTATVTQNGNTFTVSAESDCTVQITFAAKTSVTVSFSGADGVSPMTGYAGDAMTLPTPTAPEGYAFVGWTTAPLADDVTTVPTNYVIYTPTASTTLYALYSYVEEGTSSGSGDYVKVTTAPADWSGEYVIVYEEGGLVFNSSLDTLDAVSNNQAVTITSNTISAAAGDPYKVTITAVDGGYSLLSTSGVYFGNTSNANSLKTSSDPLVNTISLDSEGNADIVSASSYLRYNATSGQTRFRYYKSSTYSSQQPVALYVKDGSAGTTYYTSTTTSCEHNWVAGTVVAPTCTAGGYTNYSCSLCGAAKQDNFTNALGHNMVAGTVVAPTCTEEGYTEYACANGCGATDLGDIVDALGHNYVDGTCSVCGEAEPVTPPTTGYEGRYYIATIRSSGNYFYMSSDLGTASTKRYQAVDSGLTTLPASIAEADVVANQVFVLDQNADGTYSIYAESVSGDNYLGWTSG